MHAVVAALAVTVAPPSPTAVVAVSAVAAVAARLPLHVEGASFGRQWIAGSGLRVWIKGLSFGCQGLFSLDGGPQAGLSKGKVILEPQSYSMPPAKPPLFVVGARVARESLVGSGVRVWVAGPVLRV